MCEQQLLCGSQAKQGTDKEPLDSFLPQDFDPAISCADLQMAYSRAVEDQSAVAHSLLCCRTHRHCLPQAAVALGRTQVHLTPVATQLGTGTLHARAASGWLD